MNKHSLAAFEKIRNNLNHREQAVVRAIIVMDKKVTQDNIADFLNLPTHCISGRVNSLTEKKVLTVEDGGKSNLGNSCGLYELSISGMAQYANEIELIKNKETSRKELAA